MMQIYVHMSNIQSGWNKHSVLL